jgi:hypothetical protein
VENLVSAASFEGANVASVDGLSEGMLLASGRRTATPVAHYFTINHRQFYESSDTDGTIRGECLTFGLLQAGDTGSNGNNGGTGNRLNIYFTLRDGQPFSVEPVNRTH